MAQVSIKADTRSTTGKSVVRKFRREGRIPGVVYGRGLDPVAITIASRDWEKLSRHVKRNVIFDMELHGGPSVENRPVMVKEIQRGSLGEKILHIDFLQVNMERTVEVEVPIHLTGKAKGEILGGIVEMHLRSIKVECLPTQIPEEITVDISELEIGDSFHVSQISIAGVKLHEGADVAILTVIPPAVEERPSAEAAVAETAEAAKEKGKE